MRAADSGRGGRIRAHGRRERWLPPPGPGKPLSRPTSYISRPSLPRPSHTKPPFLTRSITHTHTHHTQPSPQSKTNTTLQTSLLFAKKIKIAENKFFVGRNPPSPRIRPPALPPTLTMPRSITASKGFVQFGESSARVGSNRGNRPLCLFRGGGSASPDEKTPPPPPLTKTFPNPSRQPHSPPRPPRPGLPGRPGQRRAQPQGCGIGHLVRLHCRLVLDDRQPAVHAVRRRVDQHGRL